MFSQTLYYLIWQLASFKIYIVSIYWLKFPFIHYETIFLSILEQSYNYHFKFFLSANSSILVISVIFSVGCFIILRMGHIFLFLCMLSNFGLYSGPCSKCCVLKTLNAIIFSKEFLLSQTIKLIELKMQILSLRQQVQSHFGNFSLSLSI